MSHLQHFLWPLAAYQIFYYCFYCFVSFRCCFAFNNLSLQSKYNYINCFYGPDSSSNINTWWRTPVNVAYIAVKPNWIVTTMVRAVCHMPHATRHTTHFTPEFAKGFQNKRNGNIAEELVLGAWNSSIRSPPWKTI